MIIISINGKNERMGALFATPKHLLLHEGEPALEKSIRYMKKFGEIHVLAGEKYYDAIRTLPATVHKVKPTENVIDTIKQAKLKGDLWIVDCDIVPIMVNPPEGNTVYCFRNKGINQYSNFLINEGEVIACNEKEEQFPFAGAGIYYFREYDYFLDFSTGCTSVSQVISKMIAHAFAFDRKHLHVLADTTSEIFRLGTLPDITGGFTKNKLQDTITKTGKTVLAEWEWYEAYEDKNDIPEIVGRDGITMTMERIETNAEFNIYEVIALVEKYKHYRQINILPFEAYIKRISHHLLNNNIAGGMKLMAELREVDLCPTFAHGDLSVTNIIPTRWGPKLIDPLYSDNFGSYVLDYAKLLFSLKFYNNDIANYDLLLRTISFPHMDTLIAAECVRVATYNEKFNFIAENLIAEL